MGNHALSPTVMVQTLHDTIPVGRGTRSVWSTKSTRSRKSTRSSRSTRSRRLSFLSARESAAVAPAPPLERLPASLDELFVIKPLELRVQRNLCGCVHPLARVDLVNPVTADPRMIFVDRRIALHAPAEDLRLHCHHVRIHSYLAQQHPGDQHPFLVRLHGHYSQHDTHHLITEYYSHGSLLVLLDFTSLIPVAAATTTWRFFRDESHLRLATRQLCSAVAFLHREGIAHTDLALGNIFGDAHGDLHLGDFRHAVFVGRDPQSQQRVATLTGHRRTRVAAPELHSGRAVDLFKADAWALGVIVFMLVTKQAPMEEATARDPNYRYLQVLGVRGFLDRYRAEAKSLADIEITPIIEDFVALLVGFMDCDPKTRLSVLEAVERFPWLALDTTTKTTTPTTTKHDPDERGLENGPTATDIVNADGRGNADHVSRFDGSTNQQGSDHEPTGPDTGNNSSREQGNGSRKGEPDTDQKDNDAQSNSRDAVVVHELI